MMRMQDNFKYAYSSKKEIQFDDNLLCPAIYTFIESILNMEKYRKLDVIPLSIFFNSLDNANGFFTNLNTESVAIVLDQKCIKKIKII